MYKEAKGNSVGIDTSYTSYPVFDLFFIEPTNLMIKV